MKQPPELLAPVGSWEAMEAAVHNGADAIYLGGTNFSARAYASNFDETEMVRALDFAHLLGVKVFVTVNTLMADQELEPALDYLKFLYEAGADAVILQDLGLSQLARRTLPKLELHASTQMTVHNLPGVLELEELGFARVVLSREVSLENIKYIRQNCGSELEVFMHGALCISYSGQCLMSSLIGGRSGNRGRCAQPCRLKYSLVAEGGRAIDTAQIGEHLLSPKDLWMVDHIPELVEAGVNSFKIEGRMKKPEYVATVVKVYRQALDRYLAGQTDYEAQPFEKKRLYQIFNRDFSHAHFFGNPGQDLMSFKRPNNRGLRLGRVDDFDFKSKTVTVALEESLHVGDGLEFWISQGGRKGTIVKEIYVNGKKVESALAGEKASFAAEGKIRPGDRVFKTSDAQLLAEARQTFGHEGKEVGRIPVYGEVWAEVDSPLKIVLSDKNNNLGSAETAFIAQTALKRPLTQETLFQQINRLGNTPFELAELICHIQGEVMVPVSEINEARRLAVEKLMENRLAANRREKVTNWPAIKATCDLSGEGRKLDSLERKANRAATMKLSVTVGDFAALREAVSAGADIIYFGGEAFRSKNKITAEHFTQAAKLCAEKGVTLITNTPRILHDHQIKSYLNNLSEVKGTVTKALIGNLGLWRQLREMDFTLYADYPLNTFNLYTAKALTEMGAKQVTLSPELTMDQLRALTSSNGGVAYEAIVHGALTMMVSEYCAPGAVVGGRTGESGCAKPCAKESYGLKDRLNFIFPIETDELCRMHIFNPKELCMVEHIADFAMAKVSVLRLELKKDSPQRVHQVVRAYKQEIQRYHNNPGGYQPRAGVKEELEANTAGFTKGHYFRGVV